MPASPAPATDLNALLVFAAVAENGGFTAAAERLGLTKSRISTVIRRLEETAGTSLFTRTTRRVSLTEAGRRLHEHAQPLLRGLVDALAAAGRDDGPLSGVLRISTSIDHAVQVLAPAVAAFAQEHPALQVDLRASDRIVDLVAEGVDLAIRIGWLRDSSMRATKLGEFEQWVVASPAYLEAAGTPKRPADLAAHEWVALTLLPAPLTWKFTSRRARVETVRMAARVRTDSAAALRSLLLGGAGASATVRFSVEDDVRAGRLVRLLPEWQLPRGGIHAVYPPGRHVPARVRAFVAFYRARIGAG
jgi:DNA-binding transcriptional LysR family regulator